MSVLPETAVISFARGVPSPDMFPLAQLAESARRAVEVDGRVALNYGPPAGYGPLRGWLGDRHGVPPERIFVTPGSLIGLNFLVSLLCGAGERVVDEREGLVPPPLAAKRGYRRHSFSISLHGRVFSTFAFVSQPRRAWPMPSST